MNKTKKQKLLHKVRSKRATKFLYAFNQFLARQSSQVGKLITYTNLIIGQSRRIVLQGLNSVRQFIISLFETISKFIFRLWTIWVREKVSKFVFFLAGILLLTLFTIVVVGVVDFYFTIPSSSISKIVGQIYQKVSIPALFVFALGFILLWGILRYIASESLIVLSLTRFWATKIFDYLIKLLASLPTLILGNAILVLSQVAGIHPHGFAFELAFVVSALTLIGLPTVLQIGQEALKDYDKKQTYQAVALGLSGVVIGKRIVIHGIRRSFEASITLAISRIIIEGYIVMNKVAFNLPNNTNILTGHQDFLDIFYGVYSTMTIQSNVVLITLLFIVALLINIWSFNTIAIHKP